MSDSEAVKYRNTLLWINRNIERLRDWQVMGVDLVVDHIQEEIRSVLGIEKEEEDDEC